MWTLEGRMGFACLLPSLSLSTHHHSHHVGLSLSLPPALHSRSRTIFRPVTASAVASTSHVHAKSVMDKQVEKPDQLLPLDPDFYRMGYNRYMRAYGIEFKEGPDGVGVYASKDIPYLSKPRIIMEIPVELMITVRKHPPWMFEPDIVPFGHPIFDVINSTDVEIDWDVRLACLLLLALDQEDSFWQLYGDFLPEAKDCSCLLLATEDELNELQDDKLALKLWEEKRRMHAMWKKYWKADAPLKLKRLANTSEKFMWALSMVWSRSFTTTMSIGALVQEANMLIPYADMMNHSFYPSCSYRWRKKERMLEVVINAGQTISKGDEMTLNYMERASNEFYISQYGFSLLANPWDVVNFSSNARIHLDSFLSAFNIGGLPDGYYYNDAASQVKDDFVDGAVIAAARMLPSWSDKDLPFLPSIEKVAVKELQEECLQLLDAYPTTWEEDLELLNQKSKRKSQRWRSILRYRMHRKWLIYKIMTTLDVYLERLMF